VTAAPARDAAAEDSVVYLYGVVRLAPGAKSSSLSLEGIIPEAAVRLVSHGDLAALVSAVPADQFSVDALRAASADADWLRARVVAHDKVLKDLCTRFALVPFRFGTTCPVVTDVPGILARQRARFDQAFDRIEDAAEWGVKLYCDLPALRRRVEDAVPAIRNMRETLTRASAGTQFFLRKRYDSAVEDQGSAYTAEVVARCHERLAAAARDAVQVQMRVPVDDGAGAALVMNAAYLVDKEATGAFKRALVQLKGELAADGFMPELTGPWPAYHFVSSDEEEAVDGATSER
jgi:hypothetical protein